MYRYQKIATSRYDTMMPWCHELGPEQESFVLLGRIAKN